MVWFLSWGTSFVDESIRGPKRMSNDLPIIARRLVVGWIGVFALVLTACGGGPPQPGTTRAQLNDTLEELFDLSAVYQRLGRLTGVGPIPFIGTVEYFGGRNDSTVAQVGLSLANSALVFQRATSGFQARYRVDMSFSRPGLAPISYSRNEVVAVSGFPEARRSDETIVLQQSFLVAPGTYTVDLTVVDEVSKLTSKAKRTIDIPTFGPGTTTAPVLVYQAGSRTERDESVPVLLNPRGNVSQGGDSLLVYLEAYGLTEKREFPITVRDDRDSVAIRTVAVFHGGHPVESQTIRVPPEAPPLGQLTVTIGQGTSTEPGQLAVGAGAGKETTALVSFSNTWVVTNYDNLLNLLRFFGYNDALDALRKAPAADRAPLWRAFFKESDPNPNTANNEALDQYFTRVAIANEQFREEGLNSGWRSDRGEVFITLGEPDQVSESLPGDQNRVIQWAYVDYRAVLTFTGSFGLGTFRLTPASRAEFSRVRSIVQQR